MHLISSLPVLHTSTQSLRFSKCGTSWKQEVSATSIKFVLTGLLFPSTSPLCSGGVEFQIWLVEFPSRVLHYSCTNCKNYCLQKFSRRLPVIPNIIRSAFLWEMYMFIRLQQSQAVFILEKSRITGKFEDIDTAAIFCRAINIVLWNSYIIKHNPSH